MKPVLALLIGLAALGATPKAAQADELPLQWCKLDAPGHWRQVRDLARKEDVKNRDDIRCPEVRPSAELPKLLVLPLPCGRSLSMVRVDIAAQDILDDRIVDFGSAAGTSLRARFTRGKWRQSISGAFSLAEGGGPADPDLSNLAARVYYIGAYELTELQYDLVSSGILEKFSVPNLPNAEEAKTICAPHLEKAEKLRANKVIPAAGLSWFDAVNAARAFNEYLIREDERRIAAGIVRGPVLPWEQGSPGFLRLPAEAEWEYAARGGSTMTAEVADGATYQIYDQRAEAVVAGSLDKVAVFSSGAAGDQRRSVGSKSPNLLGVYDTIGNVAEFTHDLFQMTRPDRLHGVRGGVILRGGHTLTPRDLLNVGYRAEEPLFDAGGEVRSTYNGARFVLVAPVLPGGVDPVNRYQTGMRNTEIDTALERAETRLTESYSAPGADLRANARRLIGELQTRESLAEVTTKLAELEGLLAASEAVLNDAAQRTLEEQVRSGAVGSLAVRSLGRLAFHAGLRLAKDREAVIALPNDDPNRAELLEIVGQLETSWKRFEDQTSLQIRHTLSIVRTLSKSRPEDVTEAVRVVRQSFEDQQIYRFDRYWEQLASMLADLREDPSMDLFPKYSLVLDDVRTRREKQFKVDLE